MIALLVACTAAPPVEVVQIDVDGGGQHALDALFSDVNRAPGIEQIDTWSRGERGRLWVHGPASTLDVSSLIRTEYLPPGVTPSVTRPRPWLGAVSAPRGSEYEWMRIPGVSRAEPLEPTLEVVIVPDPSKLRAFGIGVLDVQQAFARSWVETPAGRIGETETIRMEGQIASVEEIADIAILARADGGIVRVSDVATIEMRSGGLLTSHPDRAVIEVWGDSRVDLAAEAARLGATALGPAWTVDASAESLVSAFDPVMPIPGGALVFTEAPPPSAVPFVERCVTVGLTAEQRAALADPPGEWFELVGHGSEEVWDLDPARLAALGISRSDVIRPGPIGTIRQRDREIDVRLDFDRDAPLTSAGFGIRDLAEIHAEGDAWTRDRQPVSRFAVCGVTESALQAELSSAGIDTRASAAVHPGG